MERERTLSLTRELAVVVWGLVTWVAVLGVWQGTATPWLDAGVIASSVLVGLHHWGRIA